MRALFEDKTFAEMSAMFAIHEVGLPAGTDAGSGNRANRRDVWFRSVESGGFTIYAFATRAEAITTPPPSTYLASVADVQDGERQELSFTNNPATSPDMGGLKAIVSLSTSQQPRLGVWGYTASPHLIACDNIRSILLEYVNAGQALADFDVVNTVQDDGSEVQDTGNASEHIKVAHPVQAQVYPFIAIRPTTWRLVQNAGSTGSTIPKAYPIEISVMTSGLGDPFDEYLQCEEYLAAIESILVDERRLGMGEVLVLWRESARSPDVVDYEGIRWIAQLNLIAEFHVVWRDDQYPRH